MHIDPVAGLPAEVDVVVIGGGAAGLATSRELARARISHCLLEQGQIGEAWRSMPDALHLVSPWWTNALELRDVFRHWPFAMVSAREYARYLNAFASRTRPPIVQDCRVLALAHPHGEDRRYTITTGLGEVRASAVVCATGYFFQPAAPDPVPPSDGSVPVIHASAFPGAARVAELAEGRTVVVVGRRVSAGQLMVELAEHGLEVALSVRSPVEFRRDDLAGLAKDVVYYFYEECLLALRPKLVAPSFPVMDGGRSRQLVESGQIRVVAPITAIHEGALLLADGARIEAGMVVNATGYRPALSYLDWNEIERASDGLPVCVGWESATAPGLFFLGLDNRPNYRARTLRGIRRDCLGLVDQLLRRLDGADDQAPKA